MGKRSVSISVVVWCLWWLVIINLSHECDAAVETGHGRALQGDPRGRHRHRLQLILPLLMRISTRLATLVPTAMMVLMGIIVFVVFSKKAFLVSLLALFLTISDKLKKNEEIYIHKVNSYPEYNDEEHIHYHHGWSKYNNRLGDTQHRRRTTLNLTPPHGGYLRPFKPLPIVNSTKRADVRMKKKKTVILPLFEDDNGNWYFQKS